MAGAQPKLQSELARVKISAPAVPVISNVTAQPHLVGQASSLSQTDDKKNGDRQDACPTISALLVEQVCASVLWEKSMRYLLAQGFTQFIELGPGTALSGFMRRIDKAAQVLNVADVPSLEATAKALA